MSRNNSSSSSGISVFGLLGVAFVVLKLTKFIDWSWWYVTMPFWGLLAIIELLGLCAGFVFLGINIYKTIKEVIKRRKDKNELKRVLEENMSEFNKETKIVHLGTVDDNMEYWTCLDIDTNKKYGLWCRYDNEVNTLYTR